MWQILITPCVRDEPFQLAKVPDCNTSEDASPAKPFLSQPLEKNQVSKTCMIFQMGYSWATKKKKLCAVLLLVVADSPGKAQLILCL